MSPEDYMEKLRDLGVNRGRLESGFSAETFRAYLDADFEPENKCTAPPPPPDLPTPDAAPLIAPAVSEHDKAI